MMERRLNAAGSVIGPSLRGHMRLASYVPGELIPLPLSGSIPESPHVAKFVLPKVSKIRRAVSAVFVKSQFVENADDCGKVTLGVLCVRQKVDQF